MYCPKCGKENPDDAQICCSCSAVLSPAPTASEKPVPRISGLAIAALVLGILSFFSCALTAIPAIICGILSLIQIERSGGRLTGRPYAVFGVVGPAVAIFAVAVFLALDKSRYGMSPRLTCASNLSSIGKAMLIYANDYNDKLPRAGGKDTIWQPKINNWQAEDRFTAFNLEFDRTGGGASISSSLYLLVKYCEVTPKTFVCKADPGTKEFKAEKYLLERELIDLWEFGPEPWKHCSYAYHMPYGPYGLTPASEPGMAVAADRNPWIRTHRLKARDFSAFKPDGELEQQKAGNSPVHEAEGQNVLFMDSHVWFEKRSYCAIKDDNIYTFWDGGDIRRGTPPVIGSQPRDRLDSLLVHDPPVTGTK
jgi:hypothetical protein